MHLFFDIVCIILSFFLVNHVDFTTLHFIVLDVFVFDYHLFTDLVWQPVGLSQSTDVLNDLIAEQELYQINHHHAAGGTGPFTVLYVEPWLLAMLLKQLVVDLVRFGHTWYVS